MKKIAVYSFTLTLLAFTACNQDKIDQLNKEKSELTTLSSSQEQSIESMLASFNQIQENLNEIKTREGIIRIEANGEDTANVAEKISSDIEAINQLMKENEGMIKKLNGKLRNSNIKMSQLKRLINNLNGQLDKKNGEISTLNQQLKNKKILIGQLYFKNDSLTYAHKVTGQKLENTIDEMNEAFYAYGTYQELKEKNVLTKEGGFLGIGKNKELKDDFNQDYFSKVDKRLQKSFLLYAKKAKIITNHPSNSYEIMGDDGAVDSLVIKDIDAFWNASKYLVIVVD
ncbi:MAG: vacuolar-type H+-ATPase subunit I/STV1 [Vicingaceae bacterium]|jgi:vacuolar-type H+-ATPase subunit I/STV1